MMFIETYVHISLHESQNTLQASSRAPQTLKIYGALLFKIFKLCVDL